VGMQWPSLTRRQTGRRLELRHLQALGSLAPLPGIAGVGPIRTHERAQPWRSASVDPGMPLSFVAAPRSPGGGDAGSGTREVSLPAAGLFGHGGGGLHDELSSRNRAPGLGLVGGDADG
jgi:hypothetical protein